MIDHVSFIEELIKKWRDEGKTLFYTIDIIIAIKGQYLRDKDTPVIESFNADIGRMLSNHCFDKEKGTYNESTGKWPRGRSTPTFPIILHKIKCRVKDVEGRSSQSAQWKIINM